jgi:hypothetical protein
MCLYSINLISQDLIVTQYGDSIKCRIISVRSGNIYFQFKADSQDRNSYLPVSGVMLYRYKYFKEPDLPFEAPADKKYEYPFMFSFESGFGYRLGRISKSVPAGLHSYYKGLKPGMVVGAGVYLNLNEVLGFGLKYHRHYASNYEDNVTLQTAGGTSCGVLSDKVGISFIGATLSLHSLAGQSRSSLYTNYSVGYFSYKSDNITLVPYTISGGSIGLVTDGGWDIYITDNFIIGLQGSFLLGAIREFRVDSGFNVQTITLEDEYESMSRIDFSIGIRLRL